MQCLQAATHSKFSADDHGFSHDATKKTKLYKKKMQAIKPLCFNSLGQGRFFPPFFRTCIDQEYEQVMFELKL